MNWIYMCFQMINSWKSNVAYVKFDRFILMCNDEICFFTFLLFIFYFYNVYFVPKLILHVLSNKCFSEKQQCIRHIWLVNFENALMICVLVFYILLYNVYFVHDLLFICTFNKVFLRKATAHTSHLIGLFWSWNEFICVLK